MFIIENRNDRWWNWFFFIMEHSKKIEIKQFKKGKKQLQNIVLYFCTLTHTICIYLLLVYWCEIKVLMGAIIFETTVSIDLFFSLLYRNFSEKCWRHTLFIPFHFMVCYTLGIGKIVTEKLVRVHFLSLIATVTIGLFGGHCCHFKSMLLNGAVLRFSFFTVQEKIKSEWLYPKPLEKNTLLGETKLA